MLRAMTAVLCAGALLLGGGDPRAAFAQESRAAVAALVQPRMVKVYGAGGPARLEAYQSGFLVSPDGHVLTVFSYVLDTDELICTLSDGRRFEAQLVAADPRLELALLKIDATGLDCFSLAEAATAGPGEPVLAFSNLFGVATGDEPLSVQHGVVMAVSRLDARRGAFASIYKGPVYILDAITNNPGAAGGALTDGDGRLLGLLGKELRNAQNSIWLNYALPVAEFAPVVDAMLAGTFVAQREAPEAALPASAHSLAGLGIVTVPEILSRTPPFVDLVRPGSPAQRAGLRPDDLIVFVGGQLVQSVQALRTELQRIDQADVVQLTVIRGEEVLQVQLALEEATP